MLQPIAGPTQIPSGKPPARGSNSLAKKLLGGMG
jgi:hypothetical protein